MSAIKGQPHYPWQLWFSKSFFIIYRGRDYDCRSYIMAQMIRNAASLRRLSISLQIAANERSITVKVLR